jgi:hypothetical protein
MFCGVLLFGVVNFKVKLLSLQLRVSILLFLLQQRIYSLYEEYSMTLRNIALLPYPLSILLIILEFPICPHLRSLKTIMHASFWPPPVDTHENLADIFTKPLGKQKFQYLCHLLLGW